MLVQVGKRSVAHSRFRHFYRQGGPSKVTKGRALGHYTSLFISVGLGLSTTRGTKLSAISSFHARVRGCRQTLSESCLASSTASRTCTGGLCSRVGAHSTTNRIGIVHVFHCLPRATLPRRLQRTRVLVSSLCRILRARPSVSFEALMGGCSSSGGRF